MSQLNLEFPVDIRKNTSVDSKYYGMYYPITPRRTTLNTRGFAEHIAHHGSLVSYEVIMLVLNQMALCIPELLCQNVSVELDGLGTFYPTVSGLPLGTVDETTEGGPAPYVKGIFMRFAPINTELQGLTSKKLKAKCTLVWGNLVQKLANTRGEKVIYTNRYWPLSQWSQMSEAQRQEALKAVVPEPAP